MTQLWIAYAALALANAAVWAVLLRQRKAIKAAKTELSGDDRQTRLFKLYKEIEDMLESFDQYVAEVHEDLEEERAALGELSRQSQVVLMQAMEKAAFIERLNPASPASEAPGKPLKTAAESGEGVVYERSARAAKPTDSGKNPPSRLSDRDRANLHTLDSKGKKVRFLMSRGLSVHEVARELDIGIGEVRLIANLMSADG